MDIEGFYAADERRRSSEEIEYGRDWRDTDGVRYELSYVVDTQELYIMREPRTGPVPVSPFGELFAVSVPVGELAVAVLGRADPDELEKVLAGWEEAMAGTDSVGWLVQRLEALGLSTAN